ncbi:hypothetical protein BAUCODRAFT_37597 [Baudoinia panamericana UAMH 10762]|uniref:PARP-type domain-containing protein n=1 Tax=Baudoinia panamericana (strain UAMH 10762) TaxID=717646 RepID=M2LF81_BAUPA|nr:uncharacterized protein BAUCODRAFT_37597 [Baudoinia panamericana UAMH 10762]EMC92692.1 hypothetical protein BAUCODRAFT_37597 [Baudoinia panamericana UAMH 10762]
MAYRIEIASGGRAGCQATKCKKEGVKINKGEIRQGVFVTINEHQSWKWRHWGCVTPEVIHNWKDTSDGDMDRVDGFEELPDDVKDKVRRAFEQGHVDDDDWNGDAECNRYTGGKRRGMYVKTPKKKKGDDEDEADDTPSKAKASKKRGRKEADDEDLEDEEPAPKKQAAKKAAKKIATKDEDGDADAAPPTKKSRKSKAARSDATLEVDEPEPVVKKPRGRKPKAAAEREDEDGAAPVAKPTVAKSKAKKSAKGADASVDLADPDKEPPKAKKGTGRPKKATANDDE